MGEPVPAPAPVRRKRGPLLAGIVIGVLGLGGGLALIGLSGSTEESTVEKFARAPAGCTTTLQFDKASVFTLYLETKGTLGDPGGDCAANGASYARADGDPPSFTLALVDEAGNVVSTLAVSGGAYDVGGYRGEATQQVRIPTPGTYRLTVASDATDFVIAVGGEPDADSSTMRTAGVAVLVLGLLVGAALIVLGLRKKPVAGPTSPGWPPSGPPGYQPMVPGYQPAPVAPPQPGWAPQPPAAPPTQPPGPGWGAPQQ